MSEDTKVNEEVTTEHASKTDEAKTFTQDEVDKIISERLSKEKKHFKKQIESEREEAERKAKLSVEEQAKVAKEEYEKKMQELQKRELRANATEALVSKNIPKEALAFLNYSDEDSLNESIEVVEAFVNTIKSSVTEKLTKGKETINRAPQHTTMTKEEFGKLSYLEKVELKNNNKALYDAMTKG